MCTPWNSPESKTRRPDEGKPQSDKASSQGTPPNTPAPAEKDTIMTEASSEHDSPEVNRREVKLPAFAQFLYKTNRLRATVVAFSPDNRLIAIGHTVTGLISTKLEIWELRDDTFTCTWQASKPEDAVTALQFSPDG